jgi:hypothetical protein
LLDYFNATERNKNRGEATDPKAFATVAKLSSQSERDVPFGVILLFLRHCCLLLLDKARVKDKTYIWSVGAIKDQKLKLRDLRDSYTLEINIQYVYYESMKRKLKIKPIYECRCTRRLQTKRFTRLSHTASVVELQHLPIRVAAHNCSKGHFTIGQKKNYERAKM